MNPKPTPEDKCIYKIDHKVEVVRGSHVDSSIKDKFSKVRQNTRETLASCDRALNHRNIMDLPAPVNSFIAELQLLISRYLEDSSTPVKDLPEQTRPPFQEVTENAIVNKFKQSNGTFEAVCDAFERGLLEVFENQSWFGSLTKAIIKTKREKKAEEAKAAALRKAQEEKVGTYSYVRPGIVDKIR